MKAGSYSSGRVSNALLSYLLFKKNTIVNKSLKWTELVFEEELPLVPGGRYCNAAITNKALSLQHSHMWQPLPCTYFRTPSSARLSSCNCQRCQRALLGDWARPQLDAFCWSQLFWCNKIKVNPRHSLADSLYKPNWSASLFHQVRMKCTGNFFLFS